MSVSMLQSLPVHMLWLAGPLSRLARLSLASFLAHGYRVSLWSLTPAALAGHGTQTADARAILGDAAGDGDMAYVSSLFRYRLLAELGGLWSDMDVVALAGDSGIAAGPLVASEKRRPFRHREASATGEALTQVTNCFMANPLPRPGDLWHRAASRVAALAREERSWDAVGPPLLTRLMLDDPNHGVTILPPETVDPVAWWNVPAYFLEARDPPAAPFMHMYNSIWSKRGVDPEAPFPADSLAARLWRLYGL